MRKLAILLTITALGAACSDTSTSLTDPAIELPAATAAFPDQLPAPSVVQFQDPDLNGAIALYDVFEDPETGIRFRALTSNPEISVNLLPNTAVATSACTPPAARDEQILGTGSEAFPGHAGVAIEASFPAHLPPNRIVSVQFQALTGAPVRVRLYDADGYVVATAMETITEEAGQCGIAPELINRGRIILQVSAPVHVERAVFDVPPVQPFGYVFAIDDLRIEPPRGPEHRPGRDR